MTVQGRFGGRAGTIGRRWSRALGGAALAGGAVLMSGCLINSSSHSSYSGNFVSSDAYARVAVGESTPAFVEAVLGTPTAKSPLDDGTELWRWTYVERRSGSGSVFLLIDADESKETHGATFVQFRDGVVVKKWRD